MNSSHTMEIEIKQEICRGTLFSVRPGPLKKYCCGTESLVSLTVAMTWSKVARWPSFNWITIYSPNRLFSLMVNFSIFFKLSIDNTMQKLKIRNRQSDIFKFFLLGRSLSRNPFKVGLQNRQMSTKSCHISFRHLKGGRIAQCLLLNAVFQQIQGSGGCFKRW